MTGELLEPWIHLTAKFNDGEIVLKARSHNRGYLLELSNRAGDKPPELQAALTMEPKFQVTQGGLSLVVERDKIESAMDTVVEKVKSLTA